MASDVRERAIAIMMRVMKSGTRGYAEEAALCFDALRAAGLAIVPVEPTEAMVRAGNIERFMNSLGEDDPSTIRGVYRAMLAASTREQVDD